MGVVFVKIFRTYLPGYLTTQSSWDFHPVCWVRCLLLTCQGTKDEIKFCALVGNLHPSGIRGYKFNEKNLHFRLYVQLQFLLQAIGETQYQDFLASISSVSRGIVSVSKLSARIFFNGKTREPIVISVVQRSARVKRVTRLWKEICEAEE